MRRATSTARPVSSAASRAAAASTVSPSSTKPPGSAHCPTNGSVPRRIRTTPLSEGITTSTISFGVSGPATSVPPVSDLRSILLPSARPTQSPPHPSPRKGYALRGDGRENVKILCLSDRVEPMLQGPSLNSYARGVEAVISCGDLPFDYLEYVVTFLGAPVYYVLGNHDPGPDGPEYPEGCTPLDGRVVDAGDEAGGLVLAGLSGSRLYSGGPNQYTERQMRRRARTLSARILWRRLSR